MVTTNNWEIPQKFDMYNPDGRDWADQIFDFMMKYASVINSATGKFTISATSPSSDFFTVIADDGTVFATFDSTTKSMRLLGTSASHVMITDSQNNIISSVVTVTELGNLSGVSSNIQSQLDSKLNSITSAQFALSGHNHDGRYAVLSGGNSLSGNQIITGTQAIVKTIASASGYTGFVAMQADGPTSANPVGHFGSMENSGTVSISINTTSAVGDYRQIMIFMPGEASFGMTTEPTLTMINGAIMLASLAGTGSRLLALDNDGMLISTPAGTFATSAHTHSIATSAVNGFLLSADWTKFNNKVGSITSADLSATPSSVITVIGGTKAVLGVGVRLSASQASSINNGFVLSSDFTNWNNKLDQSTSASFATSAHTHTVATSAANGFLLSADWTTFNNKVGSITSADLSATPSSVITVLGGTKAVLGVGVQLSASQASTGRNGYLLSSDFTTFNNKLSTIGGTAGLIPVSTSTTALKASHVYLDTTKNGTIVVGTSAVGTSAAINVTNPEKFVVSADSISSVTIAGFKANANTYRQLLAQNFNTGTSASTNIVANNDGGTETTNFVDLGINSTTFSDPVNYGSMGPGDAYLYNQNKHLVIGTASASQDVKIVAGGLGVANIVGQFDNTGYTTNNDTNIYLSGDSKLYKSGIEFNTQSLADVSAVSPSNLQALVWNSSVGKYIPSNILTSASGSAPITSADLSATPLSVITVIGGTKAVLGIGVQLSASQATVGTNGFITSSDYTTFNNKMNASTSALFSLSAHSHYTSGLFDVSATYINDKQILVYSSSVGKYIPRDSSYVVAYDNGSSTGVTYFDGLSINTDNTKFNIGRVGAWFVDNYTDPKNPISIYKDFPAVSAISVTSIASRNVTYIGVDVNGSITQKSSPLTSVERRSIIPLGVVVHSNRVNVNLINNEPTNVLSPINQLDDLMDDMGAFNVIGNVFSPNGSNLYINKSLGDMFKNGSNFVNNPKDPHNLSLPALVSATMRYRLRDGTEYSDRTTIDATTYDNNGVSATVGSTAQWTIQRINIFPSNSVRIQYGQTIYNSKSEAIAGMQVDPFVTESNISENALLRCLLVVRKNATDLSDPTQALFVDVGKFGGVVGLGNYPTSTLQNAYDNSINPEIITNATLGAVTFQNGALSNTNLVIEVQTSAGVNSFTVDGNGKTTVNSLVISAAPTSASVFTEVLVRNTNGTIETKSMNDLSAVGNIISVVGGIDSILGVGVQLSASQASAGTNGFVLSSDYTNWNSKLAGSTSASFATSAHTHSIATSAVNGFLLSADWVVFNNKVGSITSADLSATPSSVITVVGGTKSVLGVGVQISASQASSINNGFVLSSDYTNWNSKLAGSTSASFATSAHIHTVATSAANGFLLSADWITFNNGGSFATSAQMLHGWPLDLNGGYFVDLTYNSSTRTVTVSAKPGNSTFDVWVKGNKFTSASASIVHGTISATPYYIYFTSAGALSADTTFWNLREVSPTAYVYYSSAVGIAGADGILVNELHNWKRNTEWHKNHHLTDGTLTYGSGFTISNYTITTDTDDSKKYIIAAGNVADEDIFITTSASTSANSYTCMYLRNATDWVWEKNLSIPALTSAGQTSANTTLGIYYVSATGGKVMITPINGSAQYVNYYIFVTTSQTSAFQYVLIPGQTIYTSLANAQAESYASLNFGNIPFQEFAPLYQLTYVVKQSGGGGTNYTNSNGHFALAATPVRIVGNRASITGAATSTVYASSVIVTPSIDGMTNVQSALANIDAGNLSILTTQANGGVIVNNSTLSATNILTVLSATGVVSATGNISIGGNYQISGAQINTRNLGDISAVAPVDKQIMVYSSANSKYVPSKVQYQNYQTGLFDAAPNSVASWDTATFDSMNANLSAASGAVKITLLNLSVGGKYQLRTVQHGSSAKTLTLSATGYSIKTAGGSGYAISTSLSAIDLLSMAVMNTNELLVVTNKGFA